MRIKRKNRNTSAVAFTKWMHKSAKQRDKALGERDYDAPCAKCGHSFHKDSLADGVCRSCFALHN